MDMHPWSTPEHDGITPSCGADRRLPERAARMVLHGGRQGVRRRGDANMMGVDVPRRVYALDGAMSGFLWMKGTSAPDPAQARVRIPSRPTPYGRAPVQQNLQRACRTKGAPASRERWPRTACRHPAGRYGAAKGGGRVPTSAESWRPEAPRLPPAPGRTIPPNPLLNADRVAMA